MLAKGHFDRSDDLHSKIWDLEAKVDYYEMILKEGAKDLRSLGYNMKSIIAR